MFPAVVSALTITAAGTVLGGLLGPLGVLAGVVLGGGCGIAFGWAISSGQVYEPSPRGALLFLVDHSWSLVNTAAGAVFLAGNLLVGNRLARRYCRHSGAVHLVNGVFPGFLTTIGTVIAGVAPRVHPHEHGHILQARLFGPLYLPLVLANLVLGVVVPYWLLFHDRARYPINSVGAYLRHGVYPHTWHEEWCYRRYGP